MLAFFAPGPWQMVILLVIILLLFGNRIPEVAKSLGKGIKEFKKGVATGEEEEDDEEELPKKKSKKNVKQEDDEEEDEE